MGNGNGSLLLILVLFALLLLASSRSRRRVQRQRQETLGRLEPGAEVVTTSGLHASVVEVLDDGTIRLETAPGQVSRWDRMAVARVQPPADATTGLEPGAEPGAEFPAEPPVEPPGVPAGEPPTMPPVQPPAGSAPGPGAEGAPGPPAEAGRSGTDGLQDNAPPDRA